MTDRPVFAQTAQSATHGPAQNPTQNPTQSPPAASPADPYLWLEDIDGQRSMDWVRRENARSLPVLENDRRFPALLQAALQVAQNRDRLPLGAIQHGYLYNFWQDEDHVRGIWRRATVASYATGNPQWLTLLDVDALAAAEHANWVWEGADCDPSGTRCMISLSNGGLDASHAPRIRHRFAQALWPTALLFPKRSRG